MACLLENDNSFSVSIPSYETKDNVTYYSIKVTVGMISWTVSHRYKDFIELHDVLVNDHCITKELLPQKKLIGNRDPEFIERRKAHLEVYLRTVLSYLQKTMPFVLLKFFDFDKYDITYILQNMAVKFYLEGDAIIQKSSEYTFNTVQLHAISERLRKCCFPNEVGNNQYNFSHVLEFCSKLQTVFVRGGRSNIGTSDLTYNNLTFDLTVFKSARNLYCYSLQFDNVNDIGPLRQTLNSLTVYNSEIQLLTDVLLCDKVHRTCDDVEDIWKNLTSIDFSWNEITRLDNGVSLTPQLISLTLDGNQITRIENTESLENLTYLCMSANNLVVEECLYSKLKHIVQLNLSKNKIKKLWPFAKLVNLKDLNLGSNLICESSEIKHVSTLPALEYLVLTGNPVSTIIDYRIKVLEMFGDRAKLICLDNERPSAKELDMAAVLRAISITREGAPPIISLYK